VSENAILRQAQEPEKRQGPPRDARGRILPGYSLNPGGEIKAISNEIIKLLNDKYPDDIIHDRLEQVWDQAVELRGVKTMMAWVEFVVTWRAGGKLPTKHIRVNTKFEDMLAALGSNEPITIEGEASEKET
jgi:hypothetical protein